jgi:hypothetical protein
MAASAISTKRVIYLMHRRRYDIPRVLLALALAALWSQTAWSQHVNIQVHDPVMIKQDAVFISSVRAEEFPCGLRRT